MDWFKDRIETVKEALTARRAFYISVIFAVATFAATWIPQIEWRGKPLLDVPSWTWGVIGALVSFIYFLLQYANSQRLALAPKIKLSFNKDESGIVQTPEMNPQQPQAPKKYATYVNIRADALIRHSQRVSRVHNRNSENQG
jgi:hypothetical protein